MNGDPRLSRLLERYPELADHLDDAFRALLLQARPVNFGAGTVLFREADPCVDFLWPIEGTLRVYKRSEDGREVTLYRVNAGELCILSLANLLHGQRCAVEARCEEPVTGLSISGSDFQSAIDASPGFCRYVLGALSSRLDEVTHEALAREVGTSREVVSRILKEFEHQRCIRLSRGCIHLISAQGLEWFK